MRNNVSVRMVGSARRAGRCGVSFAIAVLTLSLFANTPPEITNVRASQRENTKLVDIYYDAADADGDLLKVRIEISDNDGLKYSVPAFSLTGDIGEGIAAGTNKHIVWDAGTDWDGEYSDKMRVKVYAIDAQGFPGLEWGDEVPPGGFLMGQDGGAEGSGPSRHVNIPWSYWLSKYEITAEQYCEFLNAAYTAGDVYLDGTTYVRSKTGIAFAGMCNVGIALCRIGDDQMIRWNVNKFECVNAKTNYPAIVSYYGALAFSKFYGYDLPTEAEWEKAARGPDNDDQNEHLKYPWGNDCTTAYACHFSNYGYKPVGYYDGNQTPVGPDTINGYGLYDVIGNAGEWTRTTYVDSIADYPQEDSLAAAQNLPYRYACYFNGKRTVRGWLWQPLYYRNSDATEEEEGWTFGFRVVRRQNAVDAKVSTILEEKFNWVTLVDSSPDTSSEIRYSSKANFTLVDNGSGEKNALKAVTGNNDECYVVFNPVARHEISYFAVSVKNTSDVKRSFRLRVYSRYNKLTESYTYRYSKTVDLDPNMSDFKTLLFDGCPWGMDFYLYMKDGVVVDKLEVYSPVGE